MDNTSIFQQKYSLACMLILILLVFYQVYMIQRPQLKYLTLAKRNSCGLEGMKSTPPWNYGGTNRFYGNRLSGQSAPGEVGFNMGGLTSGFFGGGEPPVFYDIGDIKADQALLSARGYTKHASTGLDDTGITVNQGKELGDTTPDEWNVVKQDTGRVDANGNPIYKGILMHNGVVTNTTPEGMSGDSSVGFKPVSGFGRRDHMSAIESSVYGG
jgi:hypothetical protein